MERILQNIRPNWKTKLNNLGFYFHSIDQNGNLVDDEEKRFIYWREDVAYKFSEREIINLKQSTQEVHLMCLHMLDEIIKKGDLNRLHIPYKAQHLVQESFLKKEPSLYGRFDVIFNDNGVVKFLEYNADTPTTIIESAIAQEFWQKEQHSEKRQFNYLHEKLINRFKQIKNYYNIDNLHLGCFFSSIEDLCNVEYLVKCAQHAGFHAKAFDILKLGIDNDGNFLDDDDYIIELIFKLYPWEMFFQEDIFYSFDTNKTKWIEPIWKAALSTKAILPILWEMFPNHPNLLPAYFDENKITDNFVKKPIFSREGANIEIIENKKITLKTDGIYKNNGFIYQQLNKIHPIKAIETTGWEISKEVFPVLGSWIVGDEPVGICVREDIIPITNNTSYFIPHYYD